ncbi:MAG: hypothetical protein IPJ19_01195 [Planctomycetes bacterium]|nr:hypothetical protein [Planctomycetota bacterium]
MDSPELALRVQRLQRMLRLALFLAIVPWFALGAAAWMLTRGRIELPGVLRARAFEARSESGQALASLCADHGIGRVQVKSEDGRELVYLGGEPTGGGNLSLKTKEGKILAVARDNGDAHGVFTAFGPGEKPVAFLGCGARGDGVLQTWNGSGAPLAQLCTNQFGQPFFELTTREGHPACQLGTRERGEIDFTLFGPNAKTGTRLAAEAIGGSCGLFDADGRERVRSGLCEEHGKATLRIFNAAGDTMTALGEHDDYAGGFFRAYNPGEQAAFYAGVDDRTSSGRISLYHPNGARIFGVGLALDELGGSLYTSDIDGNATFILPDLEALGAK